MANKLDYSIERQREVVARAQEALAIKPRDERERWAQDDAIKAYLEQYSGFIHHQARFYSRWRLRPQKTEVIAYMKDNLFDVLSKIKLESGSPMSYLHKALKKARNEALKYLANPISISHPCYEKAGRIKFFIDEHYKREGVNPDHDKILNFLGENGNGKKRDYSKKGRRQNSIRLFGKIMANTKPFLSIGETNEPAIEDVGIEKLIEDEEAGIAKTAFEERLDEREKAVVAFRIGEYEWLPEAYKKEISKKAFSKILKTKKSLFKQVSLVDAGRAIGLTEERARQIEAEAYWKIRQFIRGGNGND